MIIGGGKVIRPRQQPRRPPVRALKLVEQDGDNAYLQATRNFMREELNLLLVAFDDGYLHSGERRPINEISHQRVVLMRVEFEMFGSRQVRLDQLQNRQTVSLIQNRLLDVGDVSA